MNILVAPDAFKESLTSPQAAAIIRKGILATFPSALVSILPLADGGEGSCELLVSALGGEIKHCRVTGPDGEPVLACWGWLPATGMAVIELASASGLSLLPAERRNPLLTSTYGTGELMLAALDQGASSLLLTLGGSATSDGGLGMLAALGLGLLDAAGNTLPPTVTALARLDRIVTDTLDRRLAQCQIRVACDVNNPLLGPKGAVATFARQKGATARQLPQLEALLGHWAGRVEAHTGTRIRDKPGSGAAGGCGFAAMALLGAQMVSGAELIGRYLGLEPAIIAADLVITGEGCLDQQSLGGKMPVAVLALAQKHQVPVIGLAGRLGAGHKNLLKAGFTALLGSSEATIPIEVALLQAGDKLFRAACWLGQQLAQTGTLRGIYATPPKAVTLDEHTSLQ